MKPSAHKAQACQSLFSAGVLGAGGKMGRGIACCVLQAQSELLLKGQAGLPQLIVVDTSLVGLRSCLEYLQQQMRRWAEKNICLLRNSVRADEFFAGCIENKDFIEAWQNLLARSVFASTALESLASCGLVFEAVWEKPGLKRDVLRRLAELCADDSFFCTNTSSIPISELEHLSGLQGRIAGFHFYNPPAVQPLAELIFPASLGADRCAVVEELALLLHKKSVKSADVAGFIGNGHFLRECELFCALLEQLLTRESFAQAVYRLDCLSGQGMCRPMGQFELMDYVGLDIVEMIGDVMSKRLAGVDLKLQSVRRLLAHKIRAGLNKQGGRADGFFSYCQGKKTAVYCFEKDCYIPLLELQQQIPLPLLKHAPKWRELNALPCLERETFLCEWLKRVVSESAEEATLLRQLFADSGQICHDLVSQHVAATMADVEVVLQKGFQHVLCFARTYKVESDQ